MTSVSSPMKSMDRKPECIYDVFLSFSRNDTGKSFVSHLYSALTRAGVLVFKADVNLQWGEDIAPSLIRAIEGSRISIIVFSKNYANSRWLLSELEKIMECRTTMGQTVVPLFYEVNPSHVRRQRGTFGEALGKLEHFVEEEKLRRWRAALTQAAILSGYDLRNRSESDAIKSLVQYLIRLLHKTYYLFVANHPVGVESRVQNVIQLLNNKQPKHSLVAVDSENRVGMHDLVQGMGKTVLSEKSSSMAEEKIYDVFLSFKGNDTRVGFISHLYTSLQNAGIHVFMDSKLQRGDDVSVQLLQAIRQSKISIVVLSTNYANSRWNMDELENMMEIRKTGGLVVVPVFYEVDPSEVRHQKNEFGKAFRDLISKTNIDEYRKRNWENTLFEVCGIAGIVVINSRNESEDVEKVVDNVTKLLSKADSFVGDHPTGAKASADVIDLLNSQKSDGTLVIGIWGMGGIGKTTIAKAVYNEIYLNFEVKCFLQNVRGVWKQDGGKVSLQQQLLSNICNTTNLEIDTIESGKMILQKELRHKRILLVLDDVNKLDQLDALCGSREWFGQGSRIIVTTRNMQILNALEVDHVHEMKVMDDNESLALLSWHAFKHPSPSECFADLSRDVVKYCGGLPLALVVIGIFLYGKSETEWKVALEKLKIIPHDIIMENIRISYDDLGDIEKEIFLNITSFFIGMDQNDIIQILEHSGHFTETRIHVLVEQSLVSVDGRNRIEMHNLVRGMGREIIRQKSMGMAKAKIYDVFLSFRGEDTRVRFIAHLYPFLQNAGVHVFRDDNGIQRGDQISISLLQAIGQSRISLVVLSRNYANSKWCMLELENIMEICRGKGMVVVPVFYEVDPSEVHNQTGKFGDAFKDLLSRISVDEYQERKWKTTLLEVSGLAGVVVKNSRNENDDVKKIADIVTNLLDKTDLFVADHPVGVEPRVQYVIRLLNSQQSKDPLLLGIWGMGGVGKTTIAKAIYNKIGRDFEAKSFLLNVRDEWKKENGKISLQQRLLSNIYKKTKIKIDTVEFGKMILWETLQQKRIFLVLDDVHDLEQLNALFGSREWFGQGSRIIITTRDNNLLRSLGADHVYRMTVMDDKESLELFSWHAFKQPSPSDGFVELSRDVVKYSGGLPLALQVIGSLLLTTRSNTEWNDVLEKLKLIPHNKVLEKLKISFDGLSDDDLKEIFLDITFFFIGMDREDVTKILKDCGHFVETGISVLIQQSLITIDRKNKIGMHDLLRDMGREIVRKKSAEGSKEPSRLWLYKDVIDVLSKDTGTMDVEGLTLKLSRMESTTPLETKPFEKMNKLRLLQLAGIQLDGDYKFLSRDLRWLYWHGFPLKYIPANFYQGSLVAINLIYSSLERVWNKSQLLEKLKILNLSHSHNLRQTPNFSNLPNLEKLILKDCPSLSSISPSIGHLNKILLINVKDCTGLHELPRSIYKLQSVKTLILSGCTKIDELEEDMEQMTSLTTLVADKTAITRVPFAVVRSKSVGYISLCGYEGFSRDVFPSIIQSWMSPTNNVLSLVQASADTSFLGFSDDQNNSIYGLSHIFGDLQNLGPLLWLKFHSEVQLNQFVASILADFLCPENCEVLEPVPNIAQISNTASISASIDCRSEIRISRARNSLTSLLIQMGMNCHVTRTLREEIEQILRTTSPNGPDLPDNKDPNWLTFIGIGSSVTFEVPQVDGRNLKTMMCIVYSSSPNILEGLKVVMVINCTKNTIMLCKRDAISAFSLSDEEEWKRVVSNAEPGDKVKVTVVFGNKFIVRKTRVYLVYDESIDEETNHCHELDKNVTVSSGNENAFGRLFLTLPSIAHAVLVSRPFWFCLGGALVWLSRGRSNKRRSHNSILREMESESSQGFSNPVPMDEISLSGVYEEVKRQGDKSKPTLP